MTTKIFKEGEVLTAADVNAYLVNDDSTSTETQAIIDEANRMKAQLETLTVSAPPTQPAGRLYRFDFADYDEAKHTSSSKRDWTAIFPDSVEIVYLAVRHTAIDSTNTRIEGNKVMLPRISGKIAPTSVYFRIKEQNNAV